MTSRRSIHSLAVALVATGATLFAVAGGANAATFCVASASCSGIGELDVQAALNAAAGTASPDRVEIGPGTFQSVLGFEYGGSGANNSVDIVGAGSGQTTLIGQSNVNLRPALRVEGGAPSSVSDLAVRALSPSDPSFHTTGLTISGSAARVDVQTADRSYGVQLDGGSALRDSHVATLGPLPAVEPVQGAEASVSGSVISSQTGHGVDAYASGVLSVSRARIDANIGAVAEQGGTVNVDDSLVRANEVGLYAYDSQGKAANLQATNVTVIGTGQNTYGADSGASGAGGSTTLTLQNSVVANVAHSLQRASNGGAGSLVASHSAYDHSKVVDFGSGSIDQSDANLDVTSPGFADPGAGDYHLRSDSPLVDHGTGSPFGGLGSSDLDGAGRSIDGDHDGIATPDIGAFEYRPAAPAPSGSGQPGNGAPIPSASPATPAPALAITAASLTNRKFAVGTARTATAAGAKRGTAFKLSLSQSARVKIDIRRKSATGSRAVTLTRSARQGLNRVAFSGRIGRRALKPGRYVAVISATDASGKHSAPRTLSFTVLKG